MEEKELEAASKLIIRLTRGLMHSGTIPLGGWRGIRDLLLDELRSPSEPPPKGEPVIVAFTETARHHLSRVALRYPGSDILYSECKLNRRRCGDANFYTLKVFKEMAPNVPFTGQYPDTLKRLSQRFIGLKRLPDKGFVLLYPVVFEEEEGKRLS